MRAHILTIFPHHQAEVAEYKQCTILNDNSYSKNQSIDRLYIRNQFGKKDAVTKTQPLPLLHCSKGSKMAKGCKVAKREKAVTTEPKQFCSMIYNVCEPLYGNIIVVKLEDAKYLRTHIIANELLNY